MSGFGAGGQRMMARHDERTAQAQASHQDMDSPTSNEPSSTTATIPQNAWQPPYASSFDLRSDVVTHPTPSMLSSITHTTLSDDVFNEDPTTNSLTHLLTHLTSFPAALLTPSGTMANQIALRTHLPSPPASVLADPNSHLLTWEAGAGAWISGAFFTPVTPRNGHHLTLDDIQAHAVLSEDVHKAPTRLICLENTLDGCILPLQDARQISEWARAQSPPIPVHCDGARLWEAVAAGAGSLKEYTACFDSVSLCFSKGLGAPIGSILCGGEAFIKRARHVRKGLGGGMRQAGVVAAPARVAVEETFLGGKLRGSHERAREVAEIWRENGGKLVKGKEEVETNMVWVDLEDAGCGVEQWVSVAEEEGLRVSGGRLVVHYQVGEEAVERFRKLAERVLGRKGAAKDSGGET